MWACRRSLHEEQWLSVEAEVLVRREMGTVTNVCQVLLRAMDSFKNNGMQIPSFIPPHIREQVTLDRGPAVSMFRVICTIEHCAT